jgi:hypothetical protein
MLRYAWKRLGLLRMLGFSLFEQRIAWWRYYYLTYPGVIVRQLFRRGDLLGFGHISHPVKRPDQG